MMAILCSRLMYNYRIGMAEEKNDSVYQWAENRDGYKVLLRTKRPRIAVEIQDETDDRDLADALRKAAEFVLKGKNIK